MKQSIFNYTTQINGVNILYNTMSNKFIRLNDDILKCLRGEKSDPKIGCMLENQEFLIKDDIDEKSLSQ